MSHQYQFSTILQLNSHRTLLYFFKKLHTLFDYMHEKNKTTSEQSVSLTAFDKLRWNRNIEYTEVASKQKRVAPDAFPH